MAEDKLNNPIFTFDPASISMQVFDIASASVNQKGEVAANVFKNVGDIKITLKENGDVTIQGGLGHSTLHYKVGGELQPGIKKSFRFGVAFIEIAASPVGDGVVAINAAVGLGLDGKLAAQLNQRVFVNVKEVLDRAYNKIYPHIPGVKNTEALVGRLEKDERKYGTY